MHRRRGVPVAKENRGPGSAAHHFVTLRAALRPGHEARHVKLAGRHHGGGAAMQVVADPADGVLRRRPFAEHGMDMPVDQARHHGAAASIDHGIGLGVGRRIESCDFRAVDQE